MSDVNAAGPRIDSATIRVTSLSSLTLGVGWKKCSHHEFVGEFQLMHSSNEIVLEIVEADVKVLSSFVIFEEIDARSSSIKVIKE